MLNNPDIKLDERKLNISLRDFSTLQLPRPAAFSYDSTSKKGKKVRYCKVIWASLRRQRTFSCKWTVRESMSSTRCQFTTSQLIFLCCVYRVPNIVSNFLSNCHLSIASDEYTLFSFFCVSLMFINLSCVHWNWYAFWMTGIFCMILRLCW